MTEKQQQELSNGMQSTTLNPENSNEPLLQIDDLSIFMQSIHTENQNQWEKKSIKFRKKDLQLQVLKYPHSTENKKIGKNKGFFTRFPSNEISTQTCSTKKRIRKNSIPSSSLSKEREKLLLDPAFQTNYFKKLTIYRLKEDRQSVEHQSKSIEREYKYIIHKLDQQERKRKLEIARQEMISKLRQQNTMLCKALKKQALMTQVDEVVNKQRLRSVVLTHRNQKRQSVKKVVEENYQKGFQQRSLQHSLHLNIEQYNSMVFNKKQLMYKAGKREELKRKRMLNEKLQKKKIQAKLHFRNKWLNEFERNSKAKQELRRTNKVFENKIKKAIQNHKKMIGQD